MLGLFDRGALTYVILYSFRLTFIILSCICICAFFAVINIDCLVDSVNIYVCNNTFSYIAVRIFLARLNANLI